MKSWKCADCELNTSSEYTTVTNISSDIIWTSPRTVAIIAYLDWLTKPTIEKKILDDKIRIKWYKINESTESSKNMLGPQIKFKENRSCDVNKSDRKIGAITVDGRGIKKTSLVSILKRSATIWNAPLRPINVGPILLWANAKSFLSVNTTNKVNKTTNNDDSKAVSCKI